MKTPILGQSYVARSVNAADNRMVNLFPEVVTEGGLEAAFLNRAPGLSLLVTVGVGPIRGLWSHQISGTNAYCVSGTGFYKIDTSYVATYIGEVAGTGPVVFTDNGAQIFIAANPLGYIYNQLTNVFAQITDVDFTGCGTVTYLDGYFVYNEPDSQKIWITSLLDGTSVQPLDFASAEGSPDGVVAVNSIHRELWVFGTDTTEVWYDSGATDFPLTPIQGAFNEIGCIAPYSVVKLDNALFWIGNDPRGFGVVLKSNGYSAQRVSTHAIEYAIQNYGDISDAVAYSYQQEGHSFYVISFPTGNATWVYDVATGAWHERASFVNGAFSRHQTNCQTNFQSTTVVGDYQSGNIYKFDLDVYADNGSTQKWLRSWRALPVGQNNLKRTAQHSLQLESESGVGLNLYPAYDSQDLITEDGNIIVAEFVQGYLITESGNQLTSELNDGYEPLVTINWPEPYPNDYALATNSYTEAPGYNPQAMLRWSDDGGHTWSSEHWTSMGKIGEYGYRTIWRRLGMTAKLRDRVYEVSGTDPVKLAIMGAELVISGTNA